MRWLSREEDVATVIVTLLCVGAACGQRLSKGIGCLTEAVVCEVRHSAMVEEDMELGTPVR